MVMMMIMIMMTKMMTMRMKTIRDVINKSGIKIKVIMIMWIIFQWHLNNKFGTPLSCLQKFSPSPLFSSKNFKKLPTIICSPPCGIHNECSLNKWPVLCIRLQPSWVCVQSSEVVTVGSTIAGSATNNTLTTEISSLHWSIPCVTLTGAT